MNHWYLWYLYKFIWRASVLFNHRLRYDILTWARISNCTYSTCLYTKMRSSTGRQAGLQEPYFKCKTRSKRGWGLQTRHRLSRVGKRDPSYRKCHQTLRNENTSLRGVLNRKPRFWPKASSRVQGNWFATCWQCATFVGLIFVALLLGWVGRILQEYLRLRVDIKERMGNIN